MKNPLWLLLLTLLFQAAGADKEAPSAPANAPATVAVAGAAEKEQEALETKFKAALNQVTFTGRWCLIKDGKLGEEKSDKYTITSAVKVSGSFWLINARIQYGEKDVVLPVPVTVKWAGDTPVISVTDAGLPGLGTYTARVVIYDNTYAGTWSGGTHRGLMNGVIAKAASTETAK